MPTTTDPRLRLKKRVVGTFIGLTACSWLTFIWLDIHYGATRPGLADVATGRIFPLNNHGSIVYINEWERHLLWGFEVGAIACFVIGGALSKLWHVRSPYEDIPPNVRARILKEPAPDYEAIRATYHGKDIEEAEPNNRIERSREP